MKYLKAWMVIISFYNYLLGPCAFHTNVVSNEIIVVACYDVCFLFKALFLFGIGAFIGEIAIV